MARHKMSGLDYIAIVLLIVGGLNWGFMAFGLNFVNMIFKGSIIENIIYGLVGASALYSIFSLAKSAR